jgi:hypothetical protein
MNIWVINVFVSLWFASRCDKRVYGLFNDAVSSSDYIASNDRIVAEQWTGIIQFHYLFAGAKVKVVSVKN